MIQVQNEKDKEKLLSILLKNVGSNPYFYINLSKYGYKEDISFYISEDFKYGAMEYYDSLKIAGNVTENNICELDTLLGKNHRMISSERQIIEILDKKELPNSHYKAEYGSAYILESFKKIKHERKIELAMPKDTREIANLILSSSHFSSNYRVNILEKQLRIRMVEGFSRNYIIRDKGKIIAHIATYAEYENTAITSGLVVDENYQNQMLGFILESHLVNQLKKEGYTVYTQVLDKKRKKFFEAIGAKKCAEYGKRTVL